MGFLGRLFGASDDDDPVEEGWHEDGFSAYQGSPTLKRYFELLTVISDAKADRDYPKGIRAARETYSFLADVVREMKRDGGGEFIIGSIPAIDTAGPMMAVMGDSDGIEELRAAVAAIPDLADWTPAVEQAERDFHLVELILSAVAGSPGLKQSKLKHATQSEDGRRLGTLARWLEEAGNLKRVRVGNTNELYPAGTDFTEAKGGAASTHTASASTTSTLSTRVRHQRRTKKPALIDLEQLPYVRLPMAAAAWEEGSHRGEQGSRGGDRNAPLFEVEGADWTVAEPVALPRDERPDPAFKKAWHTAGNSYWLDPRGRSKGFEGSPSVLRVTDRTGAVVAERGLAFDVYRSDVNTDGSGIVFLSRSCILHGYDDELAPLLTEDVAEMPECVAIKGRLEISDRELKNHVRCVALTNDRGHYLYTVVDEAWCVGRGDHVRWGLRMPTSDEWTRCSTRTERFGTSAEIEQALGLMDLGLPVTPEDVTKRYRRLALEWHPDRNSAPDAGTRMQQLNGAMELLTGADLSELSFDSTESVTYRKILSRETIDGSGLELEISFVVSEKQAADWIYAADFAWRDDRSFLAGYSGRVVEVASDGTPVRVYDIGAVPRKIADTGEHLYLLTDTRLYVVVEDRLEALVDVYDRGDLIVGDSGFGLLEPKAFTWFAPGGTELGTVRARDPIRRVLSAPDGLLVETRRHRATVRGAPVWWSS